MSDILRKFRRGATLLGELIKYEAAALCAGVLKVTNPRYRHVWLVSERGREARDNGITISRIFGGSTPKSTLSTSRTPSCPTMTASRSWAASCRIAAGGTTCSAPHRK